jgi:hypothetical protein
MFAKMLRLFKRGPVEVARLPPPNWEEVFAEGDKYKAECEALRARLKTCRNVLHLLAVMGDKAARCEKNCSMCRMLLATPVAEAVRFLRSERILEGEKE